MLIFLKRCKVNKNLWYLLLYNDFFHRAVAHLYDIQASLRLTYAMTIQDTIGYGDRSKPITFIERIIFYTRHAIRNGDRGKTVAPQERTTFNVMS